jgi:hypothetical protein
LCFLLLLLLLFSFHSCITSCTTSNVNTCPVLSLALQWATS